MNPTVKISGLRYCGCGCGAINPQPREGRPRQYLEGHYVQPSRRSRPRCGWCRADCPRGRRRYCSEEHARADRLFRLYRRRGGPGRVRAAVGGLVALALLGAVQLQPLGPP